MENADFLQPKAPLGRYNDYWLPIMTGRQKQIDEIVTAYGKDAILYSEQTIPGVRAMVEGIFAGGIESYGQPNDLFKSVETDIKEKKNEVVTVEEIQVPIDDGKSMKLFVLKPKNLPDGPQPCMYYVHGGAALMLNAEHFLPLAAWMAVQNNFVAVVVDFRNAPETKVPGGALDVLVGFKYVHANAATIGVDTTKTAILASSGGSYLSLACAHMLAKSGEAGLCKALLLQCPMLSFETLDMPDDKLEYYEWSWTSDHVKGVLGLLGTDWQKQNTENDLYLFPGRMSIDDMKKLPKTAIFTSECDFLRRDAIVFAEKLKQTDRFLGIYDMPGVPNAYETHLQTPEAQAANTDFTKAWNAWVLN